MSYDSNPYYSPEQYGLTLVGEVDFGGSYEFNMFVVWKNSNGILHWGSDAGCSCPAPFEDVGGIQELSHGTIQQAHDALDTWADQYSHAYGDYGCAAEADDRVAQLHATLADL